MNIDPSGDDYNNNDYGDNDYGDNDYGDNVYDENSLSKDDEFDPMYNNPNSERTGTSSSENESDSESDDESNDYSHPNPYHPFKNVKHVNFFFLQIVC